MLKNRWNPITIKREKEKQEEKSDETWVNYSLLKEKEYPMRYTKSICVLKYVKNCCEDEKN